MSEAHDELRKRLTAYRDAKALYESPDPYDREEARYEAMHLTLRRIGYDSELAQGLLDEHGALLDEVEQLRAMINEAGEGTFNVVALLDLYHTRATEADERAALAYPRALQAAANTAIDAIAGGTGRGCRARRRRHPRPDRGADRCVRGDVARARGRRHAMKARVESAVLAQLARGAVSDAQKLASILAILRAAVASGDARARVLADVEEVARG